MKGSNGTSFKFKHCHEVLRHLPKWQMRDQEAPAKKGALLSLDDTDDEEGRNKDKPEGNKKAKERVKMEAEGALLRAKFDDMVKSNESIKAKTLEVKLLVTQQKKEIKLAKVEAAREEAKLKAEVEAEKIKLKKAKALKELLAEEREIMMMSTENMTELQLEWWKDACAEIMERRRQAHGGGNGGGQADHGDTSTA